MYCCAVATGLPALFVTKNFKERLVATVEPYVIVVAYLRFHKKFGVKVNFVTYLVIN